MNKRAEKSGLWMVLLPGIVFACGVAVQAVTASTITKTDGTVVQVKALRWDESQNAFAVVQMGGASFTLAKAQIAKIEMDKPQKLVTAETQISSSQFDAAILSLEDVISECRKQKWDLEAARLVAGLYLKQKDNPRKASEAIEKVTRGLAKTDIPADVQLMYWRCLLAQGPASASLLRKELEEAISGGQRDLVAGAYVARGGLSHAGGRNEAALLDYLRVVVLFENVKDVQPEALFKAASLLDTMRDKMGRGDALRRRLVDQYPDSSFAVEAKAKM